MNIHISAVIVPGVCADPVRQDGRKKAIEVEQKEHHTMRIVSNPPEQFNTEVLQYTSNNQFKKEEPGQKLAIES